MSTAADRGGAEEEEGGGADAPPPPPPQSPSRPPQPSFLANDDLCGRTLLSLVCRGHSILSSARSLSDRVPSAFLAAAALASSSESNQEKGDGSSRGGSKAGVGGLNIFGSASSSSSSAAADLSVRLQDVDIAGEGGGGGGVSDLEEAKKYAPFLFDFSYLHDPREREAALASSPPVASSAGEPYQDVLELEREFAVNHRRPIEEYYGLFCSILDYRSDLCEFATDLSGGYYVRHTVESVLLDADGRELLCEAVWLYGVMLVMVERLLPGPVRERLIIAHFRLFGRDDDECSSRLDTLCKLFKSTGASPPKSTSSASFASSRSHKYPGNEEELFRRLPLPTDLVRGALGCLCSEDVYGPRGASSAFPGPEHRSARLSRQASMLYVALFFDPALLRDDAARMREVVDRYFCDNWVVHVYAGVTADLTLEWSRFPAAKAAIEGVVNLDTVRSMHVSNARLVGRCMAELRAYLTMGILTDPFALDNGRDLLGCLRRCNAAARWRVLHRRTANARYHPIVCAAVPAGTGSADPKLEGDHAVSDAHVVSLILLTSQLEMQLKEIFRGLLERREEIWTGCRASASGIMTDLSHYYRGGDRALARVPRHDGLVQWFGSMAGEVRDLECDSGEHFTVVGQRIRLCVQALEEVEQCDPVDSDVQVKALLQEARSMLLQMARAAGVSADVLEDIRWISDMSYGFECMRSYVPIIHSRITKDPSNVSLLRGFFLKLSSSLDAPAERLRQLGSPGEEERVTAYYSSQLVSIVRRVLEVVPVSMFSVMAQMADIVERRLQSAPSRVQAGGLMQCAQPGERYKLAMMAHEISIFAKGIMEMENTVIGGREVNPRQLLDEGLRKELVRHTSELLNNLLQFDFSADSETVASMTKHRAAAIRSLASLSGRLDALRGVFECVEDYVRMQGLKMWHEEMSRVISYNVEQEVNKYLLKKVLDADSKFQSDVVPIPRFPRTPNEPSCINFMGRLVSMLVKTTDAAYTTFSIEKSGWFMSDEAEACGSKTIALLRQAIGIYGLVGIDRLLCYRILHELHRFVKFFRTNVSKHSVLLEQLREELFPEWKNPKNAVAIYAAGSKKTEMLMLPMLTCFRRVGQAQLLRRLIRSELRRCARIDAKMLQHAVSAQNASLMSDRQHLLTADPEDLKNLSDMTVAVGLGDPMENIFMKTDPLEGLPVLMLFFVITYVPKLSFDPSMGSLTKVKTGYPIDGWPLIAGISTLLKQFHPSYAKSFLAYVGQFIRVSVQSYASRRGKNEDSTRLAADLKHSILLVEQFCDISGLPSAALHEHVPQYIVEMCSSV